MEKYVNESSLIGAINFFFMNLFIKSWTGLIEPAQHLTK